MNLRANKRKNEVMTPARNEPGTEYEQIAIVNAYLRLPATYRRRWPRSAWEAARAAVLPHAHRAHRQDVFGLLSLSRADMDDKDVVLALSDFEVPASERLRCRQEMEQRYGRRSRRS